MDEYSRETRGKFRLGVFPKAYGLRSSAEADKLNGHTQWESRR